MRNMRLIPLALALISVWAFPAFSQVIVEFPAINDSYIHNLEPNVPFGSETQMLVGAKDSAEGSICHTYVQFDMAGYDGDPVNSATLYLYVGEAAPSGQDQSFSLYLGAGDSWSQDGLTWNNAPGYLPDALSVRTNDFQPGWVAFNVTDVASFASEIGGKISFAAVQNSGPLGSWISFTSSEWAPQRPYLEIRFEGTVPVEISTMDEIKALYLN